MKPKDRIAQLERELAEVREELELHERAEEMERELKELLAKLARKRPVTSPPTIVGGYRCSCGQWVYPGYSHACIYRWPQPVPYWQQQQIYSTSGLQTSGQAQVYNANTGGHLQLVQRKDDPPDMGVTAKTG